MIKAIIILEKNNKNDLDILNHINMGMYSIHQFNKLNGTQPNLNMLLHYFSLV